MNLKNKITLALTLMYLISIGLLIAQRSYFSLPDLQLIQNHSDQNEIERVVKAFEQQVQEISRVNYDYGVWDDTYEYIESRDEEYITSNFVDDTFSSLSLNTILIYDASGELVWGQAYDLDQDEFLPPTAFVSDEQLKQEGTVLNHTQTPITEKPIKSSGIAIGRLNPILFATVSILPTDANEIPRGTYISIRLVTESLLQELRDFTQQSFRVYTPTEVENDSRLKSVAQALHNKHKKGFRKDNYGYRWVYDNNGNPVMLLEIRLTQKPYEDRLLDKGTALIMLLLGLSILILRAALEWAVVNPVTVISQHLRTIRETSNYQLRVKSTRDDEIGKLGRECDSLVHYVELQDLHLRELNQTLTEKALEDGLTAIANRRHFDTKLELQWLAFQQKKQPIFLLLIDVDHFKNYNDEYGHPKGDLVLRKIAEALFTTLRINTDTVARYGGEEFGVILTETNSEGAKIIAHKLLEAVRNLNIPHKTSANAERVTISIGCTGWIPLEGQAHEVLIRRADEALYRAKKGGRDRVEFDFLETPGP